MFCLALVVSSSAIASCVRRNIAPEPLISGVLNVNLADRDESVRALVDLRRGVLTGDPDDIVSHYRPEELKNFFVKLTELAKTWTTYRRIVLEIVDKILETEGFKDALKGCTSCLEKAKAFYDLANPAKWESFMKCLDFPLPSGAEEEAETDAADAGPDKVADEAKPVPDAGPDTKVADEAKPMPGLKEFIGEAPGRGPSVPAEAATESQSRQSPLGCNIFEFKHGVALTAAKVGEVREVHCEVNFAPVDERVTCTWMGTDLSKFVPTPECKRVTRSAGCAKLTVENGKSVPATDAGEAREVVCNGGYVAVSSRVTCQGKPSGPGKFEPKPACSEIPKQCTTTISEDGLRIESAAIGQKPRMSCPEGMRVDGSPPECGLDGTFKGIPSCVTDEASINHLHDATSWAVDVEMRGQLKCCCDRKNERCEMFSNIKHCKDIDTTIKQLSWIIPQKTMLGKKYRLLEHYRRLQRPKCLLPTGKMRYYYTLKSPLSYCQRDVKGEVSVDDAQMDEEVHVDCPLGKIPKVKSLCRFSRPDNVGGGVVFPPPECVPAPPASSK